LKSVKSRNTIIIQFYSKIEKDFFFRNYLKVASTLTVGKLIPTVKDSGKNDRIFITHDLCLSQFKLCRDANQKRKEGLIKEVRINNGYVVVKVNEKSHFIKVLTTQKLEEAISKRAE
jgi:hypothetical protein